MYRLCTSCGGAAHASGSCPTCGAARRTTRDPFYTSREWKRARRRQLALEPVCQYSVGADRCHARATDVDHVIPRAAGGSDERTNLQSLCHSHHSMKTSEQNPHTRTRLPRSKRARRRAEARHTGELGRPGAPVGGRGPT